MITIGELFQETLLMFDLGWERPTLSFFLVLMEMWWVNVFPFSISINLNKILLTLLVVFFKKNI